MASIPKRFSEIINEQSTAVYTALLKDVVGTPIGATDIASLVVTLCNLVDGNILNSRSNQDILNINNGTVDAFGRLMFILQPLDTSIADDTLGFETHRATFNMVYNGPNQATWDVDFKIRNLKKIAYRG